jgi:hypothetical protein
MIMALSYIITRQRTYLKQLCHFGQKNSEWTAAAKQATAVWQNGGFSAKLNIRFSNEV